MDTMSFLIHLMDVVPRSGLMKYEKPLLEQFGLTCPVFSRKFLDSMYAQIIRFEKQAESRASSAATTTSSSLSSSTNNPTSPHAIPSKDISKRMTIRPSNEPSTSTYTPHPSSQQATVTHPVMPIPDQQPSRPRSPRKMNPPKDSSTRQTQYRVN